MSYFEGQADNKFTLALSYIRERRGKLRALGFDVILNTDFTSASIYFWRGFIELTWRRGKYRDNQVILTFDLYNGLGEKEFILWERKTKKSDGTTSFEI